MQNTKAFIPHEDLVWVTGEILASSASLEPGKLEVRIDDEALPAEKGLQFILSLTRLGFSSLPLQNVNIPNQGVEDMTKLNYLHEPAILDNLRRYNNFLKLSITYIQEL